MCFSPLYRVMELGDGFDECLQHATTRTGHEVLASHYLNSFQNIGDTLN